MFIYAWMADTCVCEFWFMLWQLRVCMYVDERYMLRLSSLRSRIAKTSNLFVWTIALLLW